MITLLINKINEKNKKEKKTKLNCNKKTGVNPQINKSKRINLNMRITQRGWKGNFPFSSKTTPFNLDPIEIKINKRVN